MSLIEYVKNLPTAPYPSGPCPANSQGDNSPGWIDAVNIAEESLRQHLTTTKPLRFDWENKWLRGDQYAHMLNNIDGY